MLLTERALERLDKKAIAARLDDTLRNKPDEADLRQARALAIRFGLWRDLALKFPQHFGDVYELRGPREPGLLDGPAPAAPEPAKLLDQARLRHWMGQDVVLRLARRDGGTSVVAGRLAEVHEGRPFWLTFERWQPVAAAAFASAGDVPFAPLGASLHFDGELSGVLSVSALEEQLPPIVSVNKAHRSDIRARAAAALQGQYSCRLDLSDVSRWLERHPTTDEPRLDNGELVFRRDFVEAVKVEQNVLLAVIAHRVMQKLAEALDELPPLPAGRDPIVHLTDWMVRRGEAAIDDLGREAGKRSDTPIGIAWGNLQKIHALQTELMGKHFFGPIRTSVGSHVGAGLHTAVRALASLAAVSRQLCDGTDLDPALVLAGSAPFIMRLASAHLDVFMAWSTALRPAGAGRDEGGPPWTEWEAKHFEITQGTHGPRLALRAEVLERLSGKLGAGLETVLPGTTGCPARVAFATGGSPLVELTVKYAQRLGELTAR